MNKSLRLIFILLLPAVSKLTASTLFVSLGSTNPTPPYTNWVTAATNIQDAVNAATGGDRLLVADGVYATGGTAAGTGYSASRVYVSKPVALLSVNGPQFTIIRGDQASALVPVPYPPLWELQITGPQCVTLTDGASLTGFTLTNGMGYGGGGVCCSSTNAVLTNCVIVGNSAPGHTADGFGGGAYGGALYRCVLTGNVAGWGGGGAANCTLYNCVLAGNWARSSSGIGGAYASILYNCTLAGNSNYYAGGVGGVAQSTLYNSILYSNIAGPYLANYESSSALTYCCTTPQPLSGVGNISSSPLFVDYTSGNVRLQSNSPCIDAGTNRYAARPTDLDGRPRVVGGRVDMGAYEFQPGASGAFIGWLQQ